MSLQETNAMIAYHLIVAHYKSLLEQNKITDHQFEKACKGLAEDMKIKSYAA